MEKIIKNADTKINYFECDNNLIISSKQVFFPLKQKYPKYKNEYQVKLKERPVSALYKC